MSRLKSFLSSAWRAILFIWQLPSSIFGYLIVLAFKGTKCRMINEAFPGGVVVYYVIDHPWVGYSAQWGAVTICPPKNAGRETTIRHEALGHGRQSQMLGPLYLFVVGLPSVSRNRISLYRNKSSSWYYGYKPHENLWAYPEKWADRLGKVVRN